MLQDKASSRTDMYTMNALLPTKNTMPFTFLLVCFQTNSPSTLVCNWLFFTSEYDFFLFQWRILFLFTKPGAIYFIRSLQNRQWIKFYLILFIIGNAFFNNPAILIFFCSDSENNTAKFLLWSLSPKSALTSMSMITLMMTSIGNGPVPSANLNWTMPSDNGRKK